MPEISEDSVLGSLESAFGDAPAKAPPPKVETTAPDQPVAPKDLEGAEEVPIEAAEEEPTEEAAPEPEPEFEIEVDGQVEIVRGKEQIKELLQKGQHYSRKSEENARTAELLAAQAKHLEFEQQVQQAIFQDVVGLQAIDAQLSQYEKIDWGTAFDSDPFGAMKLKEQRDQLREQRNARYGQLNQKRQAIEQGQANAAQQTLAAEEQALLAKLPQWRNSEQAGKEKEAIWKYLKGSGFQEAELATFRDHRALLVVRKAWLYDQLQTNKADKVKQVRDAPAMAKPGANAQQPSPKQSFAKFTQELRAQGRKGQHRAQEEGMLKVLNRTFK